MTVPAGYSYFKGPNMLSPRSKFKYILTDLTGAKRREWMGMGVAGMIIDNYCGSFPHSLLS
jgi:hypothetical protein